MKLKKVGMRTIKTGIAVALCVYAGKYLVQNPMFAAVGCIVSIQDTVKGSVKLGLNRIKGTILGGLIGYLCALISPGDPILSGIGTMATIYGCTTLKISSAIVVSSVTFLSIQLGVITSNPEYYSLHRVIDTSVGVIIGVIVNYLLVRPNYFMDFYTHLQKVEKNIKDNLEDKIINNDRFNIVKLEREIKKLENIYSKLIDEIKYSRSEKNLSNLEKEISLCKEIYFHMQSIELLERKLYLSEQNYTGIKRLLNIENINWQLSEENSPVFNYHLGKIIESIDVLESLKNSN